MQTKLGEYVFFFNGMRGMNSGFAVLEPQFLNFKFESYIQQFAEKK